MEKKQQIICGTINAFDVSVFCIQYHLKSLGKSLDKIADTNFPTNTMKFSPNVLHGILWLKFPGCLRDLKCVSPES